MADHVQQIVHMSLVAVTLETVYRVGSMFTGTTIAGGGGGGSPGTSSSFWWDGGHVFLVSYILCLLTQLAGFKDYEVVSKSAWFRLSLSVMHGLDGFAALLIGVSMYYRSTVGLWVGLVVITKVFLIHVLNRMILGKKTSEDSLLAEWTQTTKSFLHHVSSFLFIQEPLEIAITTVWRFVSMSGHALLVLRGRASPLIIDRMNWGVALLRIAINLLVLLGCLVDLPLRRSFGRSAVGHVSYMMVRFGPVFKTGSMYLCEEEKELWGKSSERQKVALLMAGQHVCLAVELVLLAATSALFLCVRVGLLLEDVGMLSEHRA